MHSRDPRRTWSSAVVSILAALAAAGAGHNMAPTAYLLIAALTSGFAAILLATLHQARSGSIVSNRGQSAIKKTPD